MFYKAVFSTLFLSLISPLTFGHTFENDRQLDMHGTIRFQYSHNDYLEDHGNDINFSDAVLWLNYRHDQFNAHLDYRVYQQDHLGEMNFPVQAWVSYNISPQQTLTAGLQNTPIGYNRYDSHTYNMTLLYSLGLEDVNNWGISYQYRPDLFNFTAGYFFHDAGSYSGQTDSVAHYSGNFAREHDSSIGTQLKEKHLITAKIDKNFDYQIKNSAVKTNVGATYLHSTLDNLKTQKTGQRDVWTVYQNTEWNQFGFNLIYGQQNIDNQDAGSPTASTFGLFDCLYDVANQGSFVSTEINYKISFEIKNLKNTMLYSHYSRYFDKSSHAPDSERAINGIYTLYKDHVGLYLEHISARNDTFFGANNGYANSTSNQWNHMLYLSLGYYF